MLKGFCTNGKMANSKSLYALWWIFWDKKFKKIIKMKEFIDWYKNIKENCCWCNHFGGKWTLLQVHIKKCWNLIQLKLKWFKIKMKWCAKSQKVSCEFSSIYQRWWSAVRNEVLSSCKETLSQRLVKDQKGVIDYVNKSVHERTSK